MLLKTLSFVELENLNCEVTNTIPVTFIVTVEINRYLHRQQIESTDNLVTQHTFRLL